MPIPFEYQNIVSKLSKATAEGRVNWISDGGTYDVIISGSAFRIWGGVDEEFERRFVSFALADSNRKVLDNWFIDEGDQDFEMMDKLLGGAKRKALGIHSRLATLLNELDTDKEIGGDALPF
jgi:hypothetical protein